MSTEGQTTTDKETWDAVLPSAAESKKAAILQVLSNIAGDLFHLWVNRDMRIDVIITRASIRHAVANIVRKQGYRAEIGDSGLLRITIKEEPSHALDGVFVLAGTAPIDGATLRRRK